MSDIKLYGLAEIPSWVRAELNRDLDLLSSMLWISSDTESIRLWNSDCHG